MSQDELGKKVGRTKWGIVNFEKNFNAIHYEDACAFGQIFNVAPEVFMNEYSRFCTPGYGKRIVAIRNSYGVSQEEFADLIGVRRDMECLWETEYHQHRPSRESFERIKLLAEQQGMELERLIEDPEAYADDYIRFIEKDCPKKILYIRCAYGIYQSEFAKMIGMDNGGGNISNWENGKAIPLRKNFGPIKEAANRIGIDIQKLNEDPEFYADEYLHFIEKDADKKIHYLRVLCDVKMDTFAEMVGCRGNTISEWEAGNCIPGRQYFNEFKRIADEKGINLESWNQNPALYHDDFLEFRGPGSCAKIKRIRKIYEMSQAQFAKLIGVSTTSLGLWEDESRERYPSRPFFNKIKELGREKGVDINDT